MTFWVAGAVLVGGVAGGILQGNAAKGAASTQAGAAENAQQISLNEFNTITGQEQPFMNEGYGANQELNYLLGIGGTGQGSGRMGGPGTGTPNGYGSLLAPFTADTFKQYSPAYQFQQQQGRQGVLNGDASSVGALSGAASKDLTSYNQNLANTSFENAFNQYQAQQQNIYGRLFGLSQLGQNAAANTGYQGTALAGQQAQSATNIGTALAAGQVGQANAYSGALQGAAPWLYAMQSPNNYSAGGPETSGTGDF